MPATLTPRPKTNWLERQSHERFASIGHGQPGRWPCANGQRHVEHASASNIDAHEWPLRIRLAAAYRAVDHFGWSELTANHISLRVRSEPSEFLINPYGLLYSEITASNLVRIDGHGQVLTPTEYPINPAGFNIHAAIHNARADAHCVLHVHTVSGMRCWPI